MGGVYLDTDVWVYKTFDDLLDKELFLGYMFDCALGTAVIGATKGSSVIKRFLKSYENIGANSDFVNNGLLTDFFVTDVSGFKLDGKRASITLETLEKVEIYPKDEFETGKVFGGSHTIHFADGSWYKGKGNFSHLKQAVKVFLCRLPINIVAIHRKKQADSYMRRDGKYQRMYKQTAAD